MDTRPYRPGEKSFQLIADVNLDDAGPSVRVEVEFLAPKEVKLKKNNPKLLQGFCVLQADACGTAFHAPVAIEVEGRTLLGARNKVRVRVASVVDFLIMKAHALAGRDKPKEAYDLCYCPRSFSWRACAVGSASRERSDERDVKRAIDILRKKFGSPEDFGPMQVVEFFNSPDTDRRAMEAGRAADAFA
jgi:hypothetical protein